MTLLKLTVQNEYQNVSNFRKLLLEFMYYFTYHFNVNGATDITYHDEYSN